MATNRGLDDMNTRSVLNAGRLLAQALSPREWQFISEAAAKRLARMRDDGERRMLELLLAKLGQAGKAKNLVPDRTPGVKAAITRTRHRRAGARKARATRRSRSSVNLA
jgi:hypothetical protein